MTKVLKVGVAGAGVFGGYHANKYRQLPGLGFVGVYDLDPARAEALAAQHGAAAFGGGALDDFLGRLDAVTIAAPAFAHADIALKALERGVHVYTEKPLAALSEDGARMADLAERKGLVLACGHQERAVFEAIGLYGVPERPARLEAVRNGTASTRNLDVSVVLDLMIHDLDLAISLAGGQPGGLSASARYREAEGYEAVGADEALADVDFDNGMKAIFRASRMAGARERTMRVVYPQGGRDADDEHARRRGRAGAHDQRTARTAARGLVLCQERRPAPAGRHGGGDAPRRADRDRTPAGSAPFCLARPLPASRGAFVGRQLRRLRGHLPLPWLALRRGWALPGDADAGR